MTEPTFCLEVGKTASPARRGDCEVSPLSALEQVIGVENVECLMDGFECRIRFRWQSLGKYHRLRAEPALQIGTRPERGEEFRRRAPHPGGTFRGEAGADHHGVARMESAPMGMLDGDVHRVL